MQHQWVFYQVYFFHFLLLHKFCQTLGLMVEIKFEWKPFSELHACLSMDYHRVAMKFGQNDVTLSMQLNILEFHYSNGFIL